MIPTAEQEKIDANEKSTSEAALGMQVEIPYVAASKRKKAEMVEDSIVVVGQARQKKRKRPKISKDTAGAGAEGSIEGSATKKSKSGKSQESSGEDVQEPFDFSAVPNILDNNPDSEETKRRRQRKQKKGMIFSSFRPSAVASSDILLQVHLSTGISLRRLKLIANSRVVISPIRSNSQRRAVVCDLV